MTKKTAAELAQIILGDNQKGDSFVLHLEDRDECRSMGRAFAELGCGSSLSELRCKLTVYLPPRLEHPRSEIQPAEPALGRATVR